MKIVLLALGLFASGCMHGAHCRMRNDSMMGNAGMDGGMMGGGMMGGRKADIWPTVRIDEPAGATVTMERGVFGDGLNVHTPFQGEFQPTAPFSQGGYPLEFELDAALADRYGEAKVTRLYGRLTVSRSMSKRGVLRIAPTDCQLKALVSGDVDEVRVVADELPRADVACEGAAPAACPANAHATMHGPMPMDATRAHVMMRDKLGCAHSAIGKGGCGHGRCGHHAAAVLILRANKF